jgi:hypothetical protein
MQTANYLVQSAPISDGGWQDWEEGNCGVADVDGCASMVHESIMLYIGKDTAI